MVKTVVWLIGSNGTGKTTQSKKLLKFFSDYEYKISSKESQYCYTKTGIVAGLGKFSEKDCCGCDTLPNKATIRNSYLKAIDDEDVSLVVIDGIMSTNTWIDFIRERDVKLLVVHFEIDLDNNILRVLYRRKITDLDNYPIEKIESLASNLNGKINGFKKQFNTQIKNADSNISIKFGLSEEEVFDLIYQKVYEI